MSSPQHDTSTLPELPPLAAPSPTPPMILMAETFEQQPIDRRVELPPTQPGLTIPAPFTTLKICFLADSSCPPNCSVLLPRRALRASAGVKGTRIITPDLQQLHSGSSIVAPLTRALTRDRFFAGVAQGLGPRAQSEKIPRASIAPRCACQIPDHACSFRPTRLFRLVRDSPCALLGRSEASCCSFSSATRTSPSLFLLSASVP